MPASTLKSDEALILIREHAEGIAKRAGPGAVIRKSEDVPWIEERLTRIRELLDNVVEQKT